MSKKTKEPRQPLSFRATQKATAAKDELVTALNTSSSDLLRELMRPCFATSKPPELKSWRFQCFGPMRPDKLKHYLTRRFMAWAEPLIENNDAFVSLDELTNGRWMLWIWVSDEYLFLELVRELEQIARKLEKANCDKIPDARMTVYLREEERDAVCKRAHSLHLKRVRNSGESRMLRLVASYVLPGFLNYFRAQERAASQPPSRPNSAPEGKTPNA
jgi:hypothetical protein